MLTAILSSKSQDVGKTSVLVFEQHVSTT